MRTTETACSLVGCRRERGELERLVADVREGVSRVLVVRGEAGAGKSALLEHLAERAAGCRVLRSGGAQSEMELDFAGLQQVCAPLLHRLDRLPPSQRDALAGAFGLRSGEAPDRSCLGPAVLSLFDDATQSAPLICLVDDAQWLDRASLQVLAFVARQLSAESVGLVFASRQTADDDDLAGLRGLVLRGLDDDDARTLLGSVIAGPIDDRVRDRIVAEAAGNPLTLLELSCGNDPAGFAGGFGVPAVEPHAPRAELSFARRVAQTEPATRQLLLIAAAEPTGDPALLLAAAERRALDVDAALRGAGDLISMGRRVHLRHPLVRSTVYRAATAGDRRDVHDALVSCITEEADADYRAWHRAHATPGADESVAADLEASAARARERGGFAAAAAFLERAVTLTPDPRRRAERALAAAGSAHSAGANDAAAELLALARCGPLQELDVAESLRLEGQIVSHTLRAGDAPALLLEAARRLERLDAARSRRAYLEAIWAACVVMDLAAQHDVSLAARGAPAPPAAPTAEDLMLDGLATRLLDGYCAAAPSIRAALDAFRDSRTDGVFEMGWVWLATESGDADALQDIGARQLTAAREAGARSVLPSALHALALWHALAGDLATVESMLAESDGITAATGVPPMNDARLLLLALRGDDRTEAQIAECILEGTQRGQGALVSRAKTAAAIYHIGSCQYHDALTWARDEVDHNPHALGMSALPELVEAAVRCRDMDTALWAVDRLRERARASETRWTRGVAARSRALVCEGKAAEALFGEAISLLSETGLTVELARAELLYGEWLRREHRRRDAREQLRRAHERFAAIGAIPFAERAAHELQATGETVRRRSVETRDELTAQELQVATMAAAGHTNPQIGGQLFISPRTVEWHLRKVFTKLGIDSRRQLKASLGSMPAPMAGDPDGQVPCGQARDRISARPTDRRRYAGSRR